MVTSFEAGRPSPSPCLAEENGIPGLESPEIREFPAEATEFSTFNVSFWELGSIPIGAVLTFKVPGVEEDESSPNLVAVLVQTSGTDVFGHGLGVRFLGAMSGQGRDWGIKRFSKEKRMLHLCKDPDDPVCKADRSVHIQEFCYWPPGTFNGDYADKKFMKEMRAFLEKMEAEARRSDDDVEGPEGPTPKDGADGKLEALRKRLLVARAKASGSGGRRVSFAKLPSPVVPVGILKRKAIEPEVKNEKKESALIVSSGSETVDRKTKSSRKKDTSVASALMAAVERRNASSGSNKGPMESKLPLEDRLSPPREKKKKRKKKKKKKKKKDSDGSSSGSSSTESSSSALKPPLQRKAEKKPGSVLRLLMDHVRVALSDMSLAENGEAEPASAVTSLARVQSYFQILVRPHLTNRPRDEKELYMLAVAIDTLRGGDIQKLADMLAGRYLAVETAALEGSWDTAKWLEVSRLEDRGAASSDILLAARKHQKVIDRASGRGSFSRSSDPQWQWAHPGGGEWSDNPTGHGKGKKGKKGKGKGKKSKNRKNQDQWWTERNADKDEKAAEAAK